MARYKSIHTGPQIDSGVSRALSGGEIDAALESKMEIEFLDNTDFTNPVAQAGVGGMHGSIAYAVDRWKLLSGTVSWDSNGLTLNGTIRQIREGAIGIPVIPSIEMHSGTAAITYDDSTKYCDITSSGGTIKRPHLGLRAVTDWSKMRTADFGTELMKCQRYFEIIDTPINCNIPAVMYVGDINHCKYSIVYKVTKRTTPSVLFLDGVSGRFLNQQNADTLTEHTVSQATVYSCGISSKVESVSSAVSGWVDMMGRIAIIADL